MMMIDVIIYCLYFFICIGGIIVGFMFLEKGPAIALFIILTLMEGILIYSLFHNRNNREFEVINDYEVTYWYFNPDGELECDYDCGIDKNEMETIARNITESLKNKGCEVTEICFTPVTTYIPNK